MTNLRSGVKQLLRMCGHAFVGSVHDRVNDLERQLSQITAQLGDLNAQLGDLKSAVAVAEFRPPDAEANPRLDEMEMLSPKTLVDGPMDFAANETRVFTLLAQAGFAPATIFDIGAANGTWSDLISKVFPDAAFHMFEPLAKLNQSFAESLQRHIRNHPKFTLHEIALGAKYKHVTMCIHPDGHSSTTLDPGDLADYQTRRSVPQHTLDQYVSDHNLPLPDLIKLDTQGAEWAILSRSERCLKRASVVFAETWLNRGYGPQTPLITELRDLLERHEFELAEFGHRFYEGNHRLYGCDAFFLKRSFAKMVAPAMPSGPW